MYNKKYRLKSIDTTINSSMYDELLGKVCYPAYFNRGEHGWFLCDVEGSELFVHRIRTSPIKDVRYTISNQIIVVTENTTYVFEEDKT